MTFFPKPDITTAYLLPLSSDEFSFLHHTCRHLLAVKKLRQSNFCHMIDTLLS